MLPRLKIAVATRKEAQQQDTAHKWLHVHLSLGRPDVDEGARIVPNIAQYIDQCHKQQRLHRRQAATIEQRAMHVLHYAHLINKAGQQLGADGSGAVESFFPVLIRSYFFFCFFSTLCWPPAIDTGVATGDMYDAMKPPHSSFDFFPSQSRTAS